MKKIIATILAIMTLISVCTIGSFAYGMGGASIYNSGGVKLGTGYLWDEPNESPYTLGGELNANTNSTLTVVLTPRGIKLSTGEIDVLITTSPKSKSNTKHVEHTYTVNSAVYYPTLAKATFMINGVNSVTYQYYNGWNWG